MAYWPTGDDFTWRAAVIIALRIIGIGALVLALFASGTYSAILIQ